MGKTPPQKKSSSEKKKPTKKQDKTPTNQGVQTGRVTKKSKKSPTASDAEEGGERWDWALNCRLLECRSNGENYKTIARRLKRSDLACRLHTFYIRRQRVECLRWHQHMAHLNKKPFSARGITDEDRAECARFIEEDRQAAATGTNGPAPGTRAFEKSAVRETSFDGSATESDLRLGDDEDDDAEYERAELATLNDSDAAGPSTAGPSRPSINGAGWRSTCITNTKGGSRDLWPASGQAAVEAVSRTLSDTYMSAHSPPMCSPRSPSPRGPACGANSATHTSADSRDVRSARSPTTYGADRGATSTAYTTADSQRLWRPRSPTTRWASSGATSTAYTVADRRDTWSPRSPTISRRISEASSSSNSLHVLAEAAEAVEDQRPRAMEPAAAAVGPPGHQLAPTPFKEQDRWSVTVRPTPHMTPERLPSLYESMCDIFDIIFPNGRPRVDSALDMPFHDKSG
ncbi:hypothetical protein K461DRAFT_321940 [Myriangium duriaei CBS 260.36]|uniref:Uncharacterized protein n=1 Tax=Myriangium duriaei CBS 260.36 TaxID=1168546 RepID=A0A9P4MJ64_9PEZI|nr:hypothetical protein K461DRAFT_321940 [Myriangium duriaei CBS 260.36]